MTNKYICILTSSFILTSCSLFGNTPSNNYPTIPLPPPKKTAASDTAASVIDTKKNASTPQATITPTYVNQRTIQEDRSNGTVTQIKVNNGNDIPDYYMYPSQQQNLNTNSTPDKNLSTPSWQISW